MQVNHGADWPDGPRAAAQRWTAHAAGWLAVDGHWGALQAVVDAWEAAPEARTFGRWLKAHVIGSYAILLLSEDRALYVSDAFGTHPHFTTDEGEPLRLAPRPGSLPHGPADPRREAILAAVEHLWGDLTAWPDVRRLAPFRIHDLIERTSGRWFDPFHAEGRPEDVVGHIQDLMALLPSDRGVMLPLSGGLDSRLLLACRGHAEYGYTYGPEGHSDRRVVAPFVDAVAGHDAYSFRDLEFQQAPMAVMREMFEGICPVPFDQLSAVYMRAHARSGEGAVLLDGYLGDVLQRQTWLMFGGTFGRLAKVLPSLSQFGWSHERHLKRRYRALDAEQRAVARAHLDGFKAEHDRSGPWAHIIWEILHGRGTRYILNGGTIMARQFFTPVQPFFHLPVYRALITQRPIDGLRLRVVRRIWRGVPPPYAEHPCLDGYLPTGIPTMMRVRWVLSELGHRRRGGDPTYAHERKQLAAEAAAAAPPTPGPADTGDATAAE